MTQVYCKHCKFSFTKKGRKGYYDLCKIGFRREDTPWEPTVRYQECRLKNAHNDCLDYEPQHGILVWWRTVNETPLMKRRFTDKEK